MANILIYSKRASPRLCFVLEFLASCFEGLAFEITTNPKEYSSRAGFSLALTPTGKPGELVVALHPHFWEGSLAIKPCRIDTSDENIPVFYAEGENRPYDPFSILFWMLTRMEEYSAVSCDSHRRFLAAQSLIAQYGLEKYPVADICADQIVDKINQAFLLDIKRRKRTPDFEIGFDIDVWTKYRHKGIIKNSLGLFKDLIQVDGKKFKQRWQVIRGRQKDPYESLAIIEQLGLSYDQLYFFIHSGGDSKYDKYDRPNASYMSGQIQKMHSMGQVGLHPSYLACERRDLVGREKARLESLAKKPVNKSRQHYLRIMWPRTYHNLIAENISDDFSLCFADRLGFRAGTCHPFFWYDLSKESKTTLLLHPAMAMDRSMQQYLRFEPEQAIDELYTLYQTCKKYGGTFHMIWHNSSFDVCSEWEKWIDVLPALIKRMAMESR